MIDDTTIYDDRIKWTAYQEKYILIIIANPVCRQTKATDSFNP